MIISASRRTDIPCFYSDWFMNRIRERYVLVRNPFNQTLVQKISLTPEDVDGFVFCTKNPLPMLPKLELLREYAFYFQFTLTPYGPDIEAGVPSKNDVVIPAFRQLSERLSPERVIWRYDPILLSDRYTIGYHAEYFEKLAEKLQGYTCKCTISFLDRYRHIEGRMKTMKIAEPLEEQIHVLARSLSQSAHRHGMTLDTCAESIDLDKYGIGHAHCIDASLIEKLKGCRLRIEKDRNQRPSCGCSASVDIGAYNTCQNGCVYCYANRSSAQVGRTAGTADDRSPMLCGELSDGDRVTERTQKSNMKGQLRLTDDV
jgi:hypothetical protein